MEEAAIRCVRHFQGFGSLRLAEPHAGPEQQPRVELLGTVVNQHHLSVE